MGALFGGERGRWAWIVTVGALFDGEQGRWARIVTVGALFGGERGRWAWIVTESALFGGERGGVRELGEHPSAPFALPIAVIGKGFPKVTKVLFRSSQ
ncbi:hypothetical protein D3H35_16885 [Cohnella faecalis]|uniref:Uncharacterized protein n=1 Tax=Cohnella faecalis TaxID=2315694 RepID=A0A398CNT3_9BACL|nr:hypothetical protein D3H35_16885 [Cohnella faecalis]